MTRTEVENVLGRIIAIWPRRESITMEESREWVEFFKPLDNDIALQAVLELRETQKYRPSMAEVKTAYYLASTFPTLNQKQLAGKQWAASAEKNRDTYGSTVESWVYCWRCNMAITLEERSTTAPFDPQRGLHHATCPKAGSAPLIPRADQIARAEQDKKRGITT